jgi:hypothetical protein
MAIFMESYMYVLFFSTLTLLMGVKIGLKLWKNMMKTQWMLKVQKHGLATPSGNYGN